jgi:hypothetical protein
MCPHGPAGDSELDARHARQRGTVLDDQQLLEPDVRGLDDKVDAWLDVPEDRLVAIQGRLR